MPPARGRSVGGVSPCRVDVDAAPADPLPPTPADKTFRLVGLFGLCEVACLGAALAAAAFAGLRAAAALPPQLLIAAAIPVAVAPRRAAAAAAAAVAVPVVWAVRWHLDTLWSFLNLRGFLSHPDHSAADGRPVMEGVAAARVRYGALPDEVMTVLAPLADGEGRDANPFAAGRDMYAGRWGLCKMRFGWRSWDLTECSGEEAAKLLRSGSGAPPCVYLHGGGFVAANSAVLLQSVTPLVRAGAVVVCVDYPRAPEHRFPRPVVSVLRAFRWLAAAGAGSVTAYGDSAGGTLAAMAVAIAGSPALRSELASEIERTGTDELDGWQDCPLPRVDRLLLVYGMLDRESWAEERLPTISRAENFFAVLLIRFCLACFCPSAGAGGAAGEDACDGGFFGGRYTFADVVPDMEHLPPTLLICGDRDPLFLSSLRIQEMLLRRGGTAKVSAYPARHAFVGIPPAWMGATLRRVASAAHQEITAFIAPPPGTDPAFIAPQPGAAPVPSLPSGAATG